MFSVEQIPILGALKDEQPRLVIAIANVVSTAGFLTRIATRDVSPLLCEHIHTMVDKVLGFFR